MTHDKELIERLALEVAERHRHVTGEIRLSAVQFITACAELIARYLAERRKDGFVTKLETPQFQSFRVSKEDAEKLSELPTGAKLFLAPQPAIPEGMTLVSLKELDSLRDSISGDCFMGQEWELEKVESMIAAAGVKP